MAGPPSPRPDRGQAFTLEGVTAAFLVLMATLFALQAVILTPITVGSVDEASRSRLRAEASDALQVTANQEPAVEDDGTPRSLTAYVLYWSQVNRTFVGATSPSVGYGEEGPPGYLGTLLEESFGARGRSYNVVVHYRTNGSTATGTQRMVYQGEPSESAVVATYTLTLFDGMELTSEPGAPEIGDLDTNATDNDDGYFYAPDVVAGPAYNVVEVRLVVW